MDIVVLDVLDPWGMLLSRKCVASLGGSIQMDLSYATIPACESTYVTLYREPSLRCHVDNPNDPVNELNYEEEDLGSCVVLAHSITPSLKKHLKINVRLLGRCILMELSLEQVHKLQLFHISSK